MPASQSKNVTKLQIPSESLYNVQATKKYIFNETGNIMLASTELGGDKIADSVRDVFAEVSVFFAAMTKAISTTINPDTNEYYSLYDYTAMQNVIDGSGLFVHVTEEDVKHKTTSFGATFCKELIEGLLGLATGVGALSFAQSMIASLGSAGLKIGGNKKSSSTKVANIVFICEYLLGMPIVSAMVVSCDAKTNSQTFSVGPCFKESSISTSLVMHKDTYMFVTPKFIKQYSGDLDSVTTNQEYLEFVDYLQDLVKGEPIITAVQEANDTSETPAPATLTVGETYVILGAYLNNKGKQKTVEVAWIAANGKSKGNPVKNAEIQSNLISFSPTAQSNAAAIGIFFSDGAPTPKWTLAVATPSVYTATTPSTVSPSVNFLPASANFNKATAKTVSLTATIANPGGLTPNGFDHIKVTDSNGTVLQSVVGTPSGTDKISLTYTPPTPSKSISGTVTFDLKTKKANGTKGNSISGSFKLVVS